MTPSDAPGAGSQRMGRPSAKARRSAARLAAVQALYQLCLNQGSADGVIREFRAHRLGRTLDGDRYVPGDPDLFAAIVRGVTARRSDIAPMLTEARGGDRPIDRLEPLLRVLMEAGVWELAAQGETPVRVVIADYVNLAHAFFSGPEPAMVNAVLDRLARRLRPSEMTDDARREDGGGQGGASEPPGNDGTADEDGGAGEAGGDAGSDRVDGIP